jgi:pimeloyl-ACP methyl ester carboxylesterase
VECANTAYWLTQGLGSRVSVVGFSLGGAIALWLAQTKPIDLAVPVSPFLAPAGMSEFVATVAAHVLYAIPDMYWWWDNNLKEACLPLYAYPGYPTHGMAQLIFFGNELLATAGAAKPRARNCVLVTNESDNSVNNAVSRSLIAMWNRSGATCKEVVLTNLGPPRHDIIDPTTFPRARELVYPVLENIVITG